MSTRYSLLKNSARRDSGSITHLSHQRSIGSGIRAFLILFRPDHSGSCNSDYRCDLSGRDLGNPGNYRRHLSRSHGFVAHLLGDDTAWRASTHIHGTHVPMEELSTASEAEIPDPSEVPSI